ncbi:MAG: hypothetical protein AAGA73_06435 [Pseudomonadota bacterium]
MKKAAEASARALKHGVEAFAMTTTAPLAAWVTLGHRLPLLMEAMTGSIAWNDPELARMGTEKVQAAGKASAAFGKAALASQQALTGYAMSEMTAQLAFALSPPSTTASFQAHTEASIKRFARLTAALGEIGTKSVASSMRPLHQKVTANAKRLGAKRRTN